MTTTQAQPATPVDLAAIRTRVDDELDRFLRDKAAASAPALPGELTDTVRDFLFAGGKRIRPLLCVLGWHAASGCPPVPRPILRAAAALELFHAAVLIHDDIIDNSDTRRDHPTVHRALAHRHADRRDPDRFGAHAAIVLGDLAMVWSAELLHTAQLTDAQLSEALEVLDGMRADVMYGQYLDLLTTARPSPDLGRALQIIRYKTVSYTCERPLLLGAVLGGAHPGVREALAAYARPIGEAFQLRDDLLGVFGDPAHTGKSALEDLRDGKHTALVALALANADPHQSARLLELLGNPDLDERQAATCREILAATARPRVEAMIRARWAQADRVLEEAPFPTAVGRALRHIADVVVSRNT
ncbi:geranylgeranyl diphosphate synthase type I [Nocardia tenerifensis]|uniref:Geranylgeranyl diphosphate synthase type I n=1 Tax=Nocardia tenerifensis TaxID=228006 RepID=A0A318JX51_9NOCA|nr:polyprenyl synthetase family protein [Nocardia tenerifensis]PXX60980.1 geranylgeranyl diphosphate synthase type I [Nocardia tenerifensis]